ncbi:MAG: sigma-70 family RNA polymerase sigma factor [Prevotellaceae bacterium]|jgi:RNA polymerase sigma-70 factor (ECF subfamily)|nr:sigma-70 family RNA polymerase sigma factor [Prevotellaceae bacterium]
MSLQSEKDYKLVQQVLSGNEQAFARLMSRYKDSIYFMVLKMMSNKTDAEDITLEIFFKAFRNIDSYNPEYAFSTWLFKIAQNTTIDFIRKRKNNLISIDYDVEDELSISEHILQSSILNPEETLIKEQEEILIKELIIKMKPKYQRLIELRYFKEYAYEEIAMELAIPIGTVKTQLFRAKAALGELLAQRIYKNPDDKLQ